MFIWKTSTIRRRIAELMPGLHHGLEVIREALNQPNYEEVLQEEYAKFEKISIDYGIMERAPEVYVIPADIGWDDVGSWLSLERVRDLDTHGNVVNSAEVVSIDLQDCILETNSKRLIAAIGLRDLIYVETEDAVLLCPKSRAQDVKLVLERLNAENRTQYL